MSRKNTRAKKRFFVCLTGMPGAGKSSVADSLKERGFYVISMGDVVREEEIRFVGGQDTQNVDSGSIALPPQYLPKVARLQHLLLGEFQE